jgi:hypothetical protein
MLSIHRFGTDGNPRSLQNIMFGDGYAAEQGFVPCHFPASSAAASVYQIVIRRDHVPYELD